MARYGQTFKDRAVARLLPPESATIDVVAREVGIGTDTLDRGRQALGRGHHGGDERGRQERVFAEEHEIRIDATQLGCLLHAVECVARQGDGARSTVLGKCQQDLLACEVLAVVIQRAYLAVRPRS